MAIGSRGVSEQFVLCLPMALTFLALLIMASPSFANIRYVPQIWMVSLFFWRVYSPPAAPYWAGFLAGLTYDVLVGAPLGVHAVAALASMFVLERFARRLVRLSFRLLWLGAAAFTATLLMFSMIAAFIAGGNVAPSWLLASWIATTASYPLWHGLFALVLRLVPAGTMRG